MTFTKKHLDTLKNCYLIKPIGDRCRDFYYFRQGNLAEVDPEGKDGLAAIYVRRNFKDDLISLLKEVEIELKKNRITGVSNHLAEAVVILCLSYRQTSKAVSLEEILSNHTDIQATVFVGIPTMAVIMSDVENFMLGVRLGRFVIGGIANAQYHRRFKKRAATRNEIQINGAPKAGAWIMREPLTCRVISAAFDESLAHDARESYLGPITMDLSKGFKADFEEDQTVPTALGASAIDCDVLFSLELQLAIDFGTLGTSEYTMIKTGAGRSIPDNLREIGEKDAVSKRLIADKPIGSCPDIDRLLGTYSRFLLKARSHETSSRPSEAFIHCVFALDLALGGKQDTTKNTTRRSAAIYSGTTGTSFKSAETELRELFDARSKYVHEGKEVPEQKFDLLLDICGMVTECLLRSRHTTFAEHKEFITKYWYLRLDLVVAAMNAGVDLGGAEFYSECGIERPPKVVPNMIH